VSAGPDRVGPSPVRPILSLVLGAIVLVVLCGSVGALAGRAEADKRPGTQVAAETSGLQIPDATLPVTGPTVAVAEQPGSVAAVAAAVLPSVVTIQVTNSTEMGTGSGVILRSDGYILTNNHVVAPGLETGGTLVVDLSPTDMNVPAQVVGRSPTDDLAVIKIARTGLHAARLGRSSSLKVGDQVVAIGAPLGLSGSVSSGIVSALDRNVDVPEEGGAANATTVLGDAIQTDAAINPGNSGGALVDDTGAVVGINSAIASLGTTTGQTNSQTGSIGVGFAIPIDYAALIATELIRTGTVVHPYLGLGVTDLNAADAVAGDPASGALVRSVVAGSPAAAAGLRAGDVVTGIDGTLITSADDLIVATRQDAVGQHVMLRVVRGGTTMSVPVTLAKNPNG
jgi:putative serine protease PepD